ncbi:MAG: AAA family ATPase [Candidatus Gastranaerophilales bacterium]|nr:AAA family ATPase [Candidatus Gastranaerophilales bacterium]
MKLSKIRILNYKSIKDVTIEVKMHAKSYTTIFVGRNETGKSNLLEAIHFLTEPEEEYNYEALKNAQNDKTDRINFFYTYSFENNEEWQDVIRTKTRTCEDFLSAINVSAVEKNIYLSKGNKNFKSKINVLVNFPSDNVLSKYYFRVLNDSNEKYEIINEKELPKNEENSTYIKLNPEELSQILNDIYSEIMEKNKLNLSKWTYSKEYLITQIIDLQEFKENNDICLPLKNIFKLADMSTKEEIKNTIDSLSTSPKNINKLEKVLENAVTEYIFKIWPESKVIFKFKIQNDLKLSVYIFDEADEVNSFYMSDRSDGFKQFISLILSISAENNNHTLKNNVILIDEPEIHMHPSGIKYMREELLRIGRNNYVFIATHSEFMVDSKNKERHYIVTKRNNNTFVKNWNENDDTPSDEVLRQAFGLNLLCEIMTKYKEDNETASTALLMDKALMTLYPDFFVTTERAKEMLKDTTINEETKPEITIPQTSSIKESTGAVAQKFKEIIDSTKNYFSIEKTTQTVANKR